MNFLNLSENILNLRRRKNVTQEELADFIGITKASVSKWETKQSLPDIILLPQLAAYFDVTVDELLGYEPCLSKEQIKKSYHDLAADFSNQPFESVMEKCKIMVKKYYSCYPFLLQICILWLNHFMLAEDPKRQMEILCSISDLCQHISAECKDIGICREAKIFKAMADLQCGKTQEVIESLEEISTASHFTGQNDSILIQAYQTAGDQGKAEYLTQIRMYIDVLSIVSTSTQYLALKIQEPDICEDTIRRIDKLAEAYKLEDLHPNTMAGFHYQAAIMYCSQQKTEEALKRLQKFALLIKKLLKTHLTLHGDNYFNLLDDWFSEFDLGAEGVRDEKLVLIGAVQALDHPIFANLTQEETYKKIKKMLSGEEEKA